MKHNIPYAALESAFSRHPETGSPAEAHGLLCGMLCVDSGTTFEQWLSDFWGIEDESSDIDVATELREIFNLTKTQLDELDCSFSLFLPDDDFSIFERAIALRDWSIGFLGGVGYAGSRSEWPGECTEILQDFLEISRLDPSSQDDDSEADFTELEEYLRVGVQVIRTEMALQTPTRLH
jgi:uncharacterized protein YgfB (UPF0149 family)